MHKIKKVWAVEILSSGGTPSIECYVATDDGKIGRASVPFGASTGKLEAKVLLDGDLGRYEGKGMLNCVDKIERIIAPEIIGMETTEMEKIDKKMIEIDGSKGKEHLGGNTILAVSMAVARAGALCRNLPLYRYLEDTFALSYGSILPKPMMVMIEGGVHADKSTDIQEYLLDVVHSTSARENIRVGLEIYNNLKLILKKNGLNTNVGNEGAFAPAGIADNQFPLKLISQAAEEAGYKMGVDIFLSLDAAASQFYQNGKYYLKTERKELETEEMVGWWSDLISEFPILTLEDPMDEERWSDWTDLRNKLAGKVQIIGDDLTVTRLDLLQKARKMRIIDGILVKLNQVGSVSETISTCKFAKNQNMIVIPSHRGGGETNDTFMVDLAVAVGADFVKVGPTRGERVEKYNRLMEIERDLDYLRG